MNLITTILPIEELKEMFTEIFINRTTKVTKISNGSSLNGIAYGTAKLGQKTAKDVAVLESHLFPDAAYGEYLDRISRLNGVGQRFGARRSSTYVRVFAVPGTVYAPNVQIFVSTSGVRFDVAQVYTVSVFGYGYVKLRAQTVGSSTNVAALSISQVINPPAGHQYCVNEYAANYGSNIETDDEYRKRQKEGPNILARGTIAMLEQAFLKINENVLKIYYSGIDSKSRVVISILTENGISLNDAELNDMIIRSEKYFTTTEMRPVSYNEYGVTLKNMEFQPIDISFRCELEPSYNPEDVRRNIQIRLSKYIDYRYWEVGKRVEWDNMLQIVKDTEGVKYVNDSYFFPNNDVFIDVYKLPRIRGFQMLDLSGNLIKDFQGVLNPVYYPNEIDFSLQATVLRSI